MKPINVLAVFLVYGIDCVLKLKTDECMAIK